MNPHFRILRYNGDLPVIPDPAVVFNQRRAQVFLQHSPEKLFYGQRLSGEAQHDSSQFF